MVDIIKWLLSDVGITGFTLLWMDNKSNGHTIYD